MTSKELVSLLSSQAGRFCEPDCSYVDLFSTESQSAIRQSCHLATSCHDYWERLGIFMNKPLQIFLFLESAFHI